VISCQLSVWDGFEMTVRDRLDIDHGTLITDYYTGGHTHE